MTSSADELAQTIWDYHHLNHELKKADCMIVLGCHDLRVAEHAAKLFLEGWAPLIVFTGGLVGYAKEVWVKPEAEVFAEVAIKAGVPSDKILKEDKALNTGNNAALSKKLLTDHGINPTSAIVVCKPYMERRAFATFKKVWPELDVIVSSPKTSLADYPDDYRPKDELIHKIVGDFQRVKVYGENGFQIPQEIPGEVWQAYEELMKLGYTKHLLPQ